MASSSPGESGSRLHSQSKINVIEYAHGLLLRMTHMALANGVAGRLHFVLHASPFSARVGISLNCLRGRRSSHRAVLRYQSTASVATLRHALDEMYIHG